VDLDARPASDADVPAVVQLQAAWEAHWFGAPEQDEAELRESFDRVDPLATRSRLLHSDGRLVAAAWWWHPAHSTLLVDPEVDATPLYEVLVPWLARSGADVTEALDCDQVLRDALTRHGWRHARSSFELTRDASAVAEPEWPVGVTTSRLDAHAAEVHRLVYEEARWADIPGHSSRTFGEWQSLFLGADVDPDLQVLAWRDGRLVGAAVIRVFSDGMGWVSQLAVAPDERGKGLGTALLAESFRRLLSTGADKLGLAVSAANVDALRLYRGVGLEVHREWMAYLAPHAG
jgi:mycothiol synthase